MNIPFTPPDAPEPPSEHFACRGCGKNTMQFEDGGWEHEANCLALKLQERTKERDAMFASVTELEAERIALGNRLGEWQDVARQKQEIIDTERQQVEHQTKRALDAESRLDECREALRVVIEEAGDGGAMLAANAICSRPDLRNVIEGAWPGVVERRVPICGAPDPNDECDECALDLGHEGPHHYVTA